MLRILRISSRNCLASSPSIFNLFLTLPKNRHSLRFRNLNYTKRQNSRTIPIPISFNCNFIRGRRFDAFAPVEEISPRQPCSFSSNSDSHKGKCIVANSGRARPIYSPREISSFRGARFDFSTLSCDSALREEEEGKGDPRRESGRPSCAFIQPSTFLRLSPYKYLRRVAEYVVPFEGPPQIGVVLRPSGVQLHGHLCGPLVLAAKVTPAETS